MSDIRRTHRWRGVLVITLGAAGVGLLAKRPLLLVVSTLGLVYAVYPSLSSVSEPELELDRRITDDHPEPGETVEVTTTVRNTGSRPIFDLRVVDGVPPALPVTSGTPRFGTTLWPGSSATVSYEVAAERGRHRFTDAIAIVRDLSGDHEAEVQLNDDTEIECPADIGRAPLQSQTLDVVGQQPADSGGSGTEFHQTRAYRRGDPMGRIDWNRYARTGSLTTIEFREEQAASVIVVVDTTASAYRGSPHAVAAGVGAAQQLIKSVLDDQNHVGLASLGRDGVWLAPDSGHQHRLRAQELLASHRAFASRPPEPDAVGSVPQQVERLLERIGDHMQLLLVSPLLDDAITEGIQRLHAHGYPVTVVSPDVTVSGGGADGQRLATIERENRLRRLRQSGITVVDWPTDDPLGSTLHRQLSEVHG